jgi:hypothetical protein
MLQVGYRAGYRRITGHVTGWLQGVLQAVYSLFTGGLKVPLMFDNFLVVSFHFDHSFIGFDQSGFALLFGHRINLLFKRMDAELLF